MRRNWSCVVTEWRIFQKSLRLSILHVISAEFFGTGLKIVLNLRLTPDCGTYCFVKRVDFNEVKRQEAQSCMAVARKARHSSQMAAALQEAPPLRDSHPPCTITLKRTRAASPRRRTTSRSFLPIFIALALVGMAGEPQLKAQVPQWVCERIKDFAEFLEVDGTNNVNANNGGAVALAEVCRELHRSEGHFGTASPGSSSGAGTMFGTASLGGNSGQGTVFALNTDGTGFSVLHNFTNRDGAFPAAGLILSGDTLYGTTENGGGSDNGTVFAMTTNGTGFTVLHNFTARNRTTFTNSDGAAPTAALILSGNMLYGTANRGGSGNEGTVFALNINNTNFTVLHSFTVANYDPNFNLTNSDGANPDARLILSGDTLYGTASRGGTGAAGSVFAVNTNGTVFKVLHDFSAVDFLTLTNSDGANPQAGLILSGDTLYGTAFQGGSANSGTVFAVNTNGTIFTNLYSFTGGSDGASPVAELVLSSNTLFGTARAGGNSGGEGTVFALNTDGSGFTVLHGFTVEYYDSNGNPTNSDGANPQAGLVFSGDTLYGTTSGGGSGGNGTVFSLSFVPAQLTILGVTLSGTNLVINGANGQSGGAYATLMSPDLSLPLNQWTPVATNVLNVTGDFTFTATNAVDAKAPQRFYILQTQ
jgi:uncharacterized repeat protein (TIGR03803 family)